MTIKNVSLTSPSLSSYPVSSSRSSSTFSIFNSELPNQLLKYAFSFLPIEETTNQISLVSIRFFALANLYAQQRVRGEFSPLWYHITKSRKFPFGFFLVNFAPRLVQYVHLWNPIETDEKRESEGGTNPKRIKYSPEATDQKPKATKKLSWFLPVAEMKYKEEGADEVSRDLDKIYYIEGLDAKTDKISVIQTLIRAKIGHKHPHNKPTRAFYEELLRFAKWQHIDFGELDLDWDQILSINFLNLKALKFKNQRLPNDLSTINTATKLHIDYITEEKLPLLKQFSNLKELSFSVGMRSINNFDPLTTLSIKKLSIGGFDFVYKESALLKALKQMTSVTHFSVSSFRNEWDMKECVEILPKLQEVDIEISEAFLGTTIFNSYMRKGIIRFLKAHSSLRSIHIHVPIYESKGQTLDETKPWLWVGCKNPAVPLLNLFSELNNSPCQIRLTACFKD